MGLIKSKQERENNRIAKKVEKEEAKKRKQEYNAEWAKVIAYPGSKSDYEDFMGYERGTVEVIDTGNTDKAILYYLNSGNASVSLYNNSDKIKLVDMGIEALLTQGSGPGDNYMFGPAIRRKDWNEDQDQKKVK